MKVTINKNLILRALVNQEKKVYICVCVCVFLRRKKNIYIYKNIRQMNSGLQLVCAYIIIIIIMAHVSFTLKIYRFYQKQTS